MTIDALDAAILRIVQQNNKTPRRAIGKATGLSAAAVQRRIAALEARKIIVKNTAILEPSAASLFVTSVVEVHLNDERAATVDLAKSLFRKAPEVQQAYYVTGGPHFIVFVLTKDLQSYEDAAKRLFSNNDLVQSFHTLIVADRVKVDTSIVV